jgi:PilZ domain-containing protein
MDRRAHHRAQLRLPVRLRWATPLGQKTEVRETLDASRGGLLVPCDESHAPGVSLWVTFPFDISPGNGQPEILAKVVRSAAVSNGDRAAPAKHFRDESAKNTNGSPHAAVAVHFEPTPRTHSNGNRAPRTEERRASLRRQLAMPVRVRPEDIWWFEEAMTTDVSDQGLRLLSNREYRTGEHLFISFEPSSTSPWPGPKEFRSRVVRVDTVPQSPALAISVCRLRS